MIEQLDLFGELEPKQEEKKVVIPEPVKPIETKPKEAIKQTISKEIEFDTFKALSYLKNQDYDFWDMRCHPYKTYQGLMRFLKDFEENLKKTKGDYIPGGTLDPHGCRLIGKLIRNNVSLDTIAANLILNTNVTFLRRKVQCWSNKEICPFWKHYGNFSDCNCERRCNKGEIIGDEKLILK